MVIWKFLGGALTVWSFVIKQVLCPEQLRRLIKAQPRALCRNHHSYYVVIASFNWMQWEKIYGISSLRFLAFSFFLFCYLWLVEWKGFWVIKKGFLFWQANIWSYFSGLYFLYLLLPSSCMSVWNENVNEKAEMFHFSLKEKEKKPRVVMNSLSLSLEIVGSYFFVLFWVLFFYPESAFPLILANPAPKSYWVDPISFFNVMFFYSYFFDLFLLVSSRIGIAL